MQLAITFDVFNTIIRLGDAARRSIVRNIVNALEGFGVRLSHEDVMRIYVEVDKEVRKRRAICLSLIPPFENTRYLTKRLLEFANKEYSDEIARSVYNAIEQGLLEYDIELMPNAETAITKAKEKGLKVGLVSNVTFWSSSITRKLLEKAGLLRHFDVQLYADEIGVVKPHPLIFEKAKELLGAKAIIHVGDGFKEDFLGALLGDCVGVLYDIKRQYANGVKEVLKCKAYIIDDLSRLIEVVDLYVKNCI